MVKEHQSRQQLRKERQGKGCSDIAKILIIYINLHQFVDPILVRKWWWLKNLFIIISLTELRKKDASAAATALTHALVDHLNTG